jgi:hypothetical protein
MFFKHFDGVTQTAIYLTFRYSVIFKNPSSSEDPGFKSSSEDQTFCIIPRPAPQFSAGRY